MGGFLALIQYPRIEGLPSPRLTGHGARHWAEGKGSFSASLELGSGFRSQQSPAFAALPEPSCSLPSSGIVSLQGTKTHSVQRKSKVIHWKGVGEAHQNEAQEAQLGLMWPGSHQTLANFSGSLRSLWLLAFTLRVLMHPLSRPAPLTAQSVTSLPSAFRAVAGFLTPLFMVVKYTQQKIYHF